MSVSFRLRSARAQARMSDAPFHEWLAPEGRPWTSFHRTASGYLLRFPDLADFEISADALRVECRPAPGATRETCAHLFRNQVWPLAMSRQGKLIFHASSVEIGEGAAAFVAESGRGKSTLAATLATAGHRFLGDDSLVVEERDAEFWAIPGDPSIRLWQDSEAVLGQRPHATAPGVQYTHKTRYLAGEGLPHCGRPIRLRTAYFLGDGDARRFVVERMSGSEALMAWVRNSFLLDTGERSQVAGHFDRVAALANRLACYRLDYPRSFEELAELRRAIVEHHLACGSSI